MGEFVGQGLYLKFGTATYNSDYRTFDHSEDIGMVDSSAGADTFRSRITTLKDGAGSLELVAQAGNTVIWPAFVPGTSGTLLWGEEGTATNKPKHQVTDAIVKSRSMPVKYEDLVVYKFDLQFNGIVTDSVFP